MTIVIKFKTPTIRFIFSLIFFLSFSSFFVAQNITSLSKDEQNLDNKLSKIKTELLQDSEKNKFTIYNSSFSQLKPFIETTELFKILSKMPKGALLHSHSGGIANTDWLINKASEYENCYIFINQDQQKYIYGQLMIFEKEEIPVGFIKLNNFLKSNANAKEKLRDLYTLKRNNLSEYIDYWSEFEKRFQRIGSILNYRPIFKEYYQEAFLELLKDNVQHVEIRYIFGQLFDEKNKNYPI